jgi:putative membrane protein
MLARMPIAARVLVALVALLHVYFLVLEMFLWSTPFGMKTFGRTREEQMQTKALAGNQGLYNGFLAAGLVWSLVAGPALAFPLKIFFLACVLVAGLYGAATASRKILWVQAMPAVVALVLVHLANP